MEVVREIKVDFYVLKTGSPKYISFFDNSDWLYSENLPSYLTIKVPGSKKEKVFTFKKNSITTLNSHNLGISCLKGDCKEEQYVDLPDGIYTVTIKSGYQNIEETKYYLKTDNFEIGFAKVMIKYGIDYTDKDFISHMTKIKFLLSVAESHTVLGDFVKAQRFFEEAKKTLNDYTKCQL